MSEEDNRLVSNRVLLSITLLFSLMTFVAVTGNPGIEIREEKTFDRITVDRGSGGIATYVPGDLERNDFVCSDEEVDLHVYQIYTEEGTGVSMYYSGEDQATCVYPVTQKYKEAVVYGFTVYDWKVERGLIR